MFKSFAKKLAFRFPPTRHLLDHNQLLAVKSKILSAHTIDPNFDQMLGFEFPGPEAYLRKDLFDYHQLLEKFFATTTQLPKNKTARHHSHHSYQPQLIVSLASFPERIPDLKYCLYSLFHQSHQPHKIVLWLAKTQFPQLEKDLPPEILNFKKHGLEIAWCNRDLRSYKKLLPTLKKYPHDIIVTADDDIFYPYQWLQKLYDSYLQQPTLVHCHRAHQITFQDQKLLPYNQWRHCLPGPSSAQQLIFATGAGGVLYPPGIFHRDITKQKLFSTLCPNNDDIWFFTMTLLAGHQLQIVPDNISALIYLDLDRERGRTDQFALRQHNIDQNDNDLQLARVLKHYPQLADLFQEAISSSKTTTLPTKNQERLHPQFYQSNPTEQFLFAKHLYAYQFALEQAQLLLSQSDSDQPFTILDFGTGDGYGANFLAQHLLQANIIATDLDSKTINSARQKYKQPNLKFITFEKFQLLAKNSHLSPSKDKTVSSLPSTFQLITSFQVIEHVANVSSYLTQFKNLLSPTGQLLLSTPNRLYRLNHHQKPWNPHHRREYEYQSFAKALHKIFPPSKTQITTLLTSRRLLKLEYQRVANSRRDQTPLVIPSSFKFENEKESKLNSSPSINDNFYLSSRSEDFVFGLDLFALCQK